MKFYFVIAQLNYPSFHDISTAYYTDRTEEKWVKDIAKANLYRPCQDVGCNIEGYAEDEISGFNSGYFTIIKIYAK